MTFDELVPVVFEPYLPYLTQLYYLLIIFSTLILIWKAYKMILNTTVNTDVYEQEQDLLTREHEAQMAIALSQVQKQRNQHLDRTAPHISQKPDAIKEHKTKHDPSERFENIIE